MGEVVCVSVIYVHRAQRLAGCFVRVRPSGWWWIVKVFHRSTPYVFAGCASVFIFRPECLVSYMDFVRVCGVVFFLRLHLCFVWYNYVHMNAWRVCVVRVYGRVRARCVPA